MLDTDLDPYDYKSFLRWQGDQDIQSGDYVVWSRKLDLACYREHLKTFSGIDIYRQVPYASHAEAE